MECVSNGPVIIIIYREAERTAWRMSSTQIQSLALHEHGRLLTNLKVSNK